MESESLRARIKSLPDEKLVQMVENKSGDYTPEAVTIAREEIEARGGLDFISKPTEESKPQGTEQKQELKQKETAKKGQVQTKRILQIDRQTSTVEYEDYGKLHTDILSGILRKDDKARILVKSIPEKKDAKKEPKWSTLEKVSSVNFKLRTLYRPVWAYTMKACGIGVLVGIVIKAIDTTVLLFSANLGLGILWLMIVGSLTVTKWIPWAPFLMIVILIIAKVKANLWITWLAVMAIGAIFGAPGGMVVGTIIGHFKKDKFPRAMDAAPEGAKPYVFGLLIPLVFLAVAFPLYLFWFTPMVMQWLSMR